MTKRLMLVLVLALAAGACGGGDVKVATVNGSELLLADIPVEPDGFDVGRDIFLDALIWEIRVRVLLSAAEAEFGIAVDAGEVAANAAQLLAGLPPENQSDPRANLAYFETQARVGLLGPLLGEAIGDDLAAANWANTALRNADVTVARRFGVWRVDPEPRVYPE